MSANILDPRMIDPTRPLSSVQVNTPLLNADTIQTGNLQVDENFATNSITASSIYTDVLTTSAADFNILTCTDATVRGTLVANNTLVTTFTATTVSVSSYTFTNDDTGKVFHFDTTTQPEITAIFAPSPLIIDGFNVGIVNTGTGVIYLSSEYTPTIVAANPFNSTQYSGMFIYQINNQLFGIGIFE